MKDQIVIQACANAMDDCYRIIVLENEFEALLAVAKKFEYHRRFYKRSSY